MTNKLGVKVPAVLNVSLSYAAAIDTFLLNTELPFDATMLGFEVYGAVAGKINIRSVKFSYCGTTIKCGEYFRNNHDFVNKGSTNSINGFNFVAGYNYISLGTPRALTKGTMILARVDSGAVALDTSNNYAYDDLYDLNQYLYPVNDQNNTRLYLNIIIDRYFYRSSIFISKILLLNETIINSNLTWKMSDSSIESTTKISLTNCKKS